MDHEDSPPRTRRELLDEFRARNAAYMAERWPTEADRRRERARAQWSPQLRRQREALRRNLGRPTVPTAAPRRREHHGATPTRTVGSRRSSSSSRTSGSDPGSDDDGESDPEPPPPRPRLAPPPRAIYTYACLTAAERGAEVEAVAS